MSFIEEPIGSLHKVGHGEFQRVYLCWKMCGCQLECVRTQTQSSTHLLLIDKLKYLLNKSVKKIQQTLARYFHIL